EEAGEFRIGRDDQADRRARDPFGELVDDVGADLEQDDGADRDQEQRGERTAAAVEQVQRAAQRRGRRSRRHGHAGSAEPAYFLYASSSALPSAPALLTHSSVMVLPMAAKPALSWALGSTISMPLSAMILVFLAISSLLAAHPRVSAF